MATKQIQGTANFELSVLKACLLFTTCAEGREFKSKIQDILTPAMFSSKPLWIITATIMAWYKSFSESPPKDVFEDYLRDYITAKHQNELKNFETVYKPVLDAIWKQEIVWDSMIQKVIVYAEQRIIIETISKAIDDIKSTPLEYDKDSSPMADLAHSIARSLLRVDNLRRDESQICSIGIEENLTAEQMLSLCDVTENVVADINISNTNFGILKPYINGGFFRGELGCVSAKPGSGKTCLLTAFGAEALRDGKKVLHVSLENKAGKILQGYIRNEVQGELNLETIQACLSDSYPVYKNLSIQQFPTGTLTFNGLEDLIKKVKVEKGWLPDLIIVDYAELMKRGSKNIPIHEWLPTVFIGLRDLAFKYKCHVLTANQINRTGASKKSATQEDTAGSYAINNTCDQMYIIQTTDKEVQDGHFRIYVAKSRNAQDKVTIDCAVNLMNKTVRTLQLVDVEEEEMASSYKSMRQGRKDDYKKPDIQFNPIDISEEL